jgi:hypothetical protein
MTPVDLKRTGLVALICALILVLAGAGPALGSDDSGNEESSTQAEGEESQDGKTCPDHDRGKGASKDDSDEVEDAESDEADDVEGSDDDEGDEGDESDERGRYSDDDEDKSDRGQGRKCGHRKEEAEPAPSPSPTPSPTEDESRDASKTSSDEDERSTQERTTTSRTETKTRSTSTASEEEAVQPAKPVAKTVRTDTVTSVHKESSAPRPLPIGAPVGSVGGSIGGGFSGLGPAVFGAPGKVCPSGPWKGMPYTNIKECGDAVLGKVLARTGSHLIAAIGAGFGLLLAGLLMLRSRRFT